MRTFLIAGAGLALAAGGAVDAQQRIIQPGPGASYGTPDRAPMVQARTAPIARTNTMQVGRMHRGDPRWGSKVDGRWWGGANAPGGWAGYRRPQRGWAVPAYWNAQRFYVTDWSTYGLSQPPAGYNWVRYYDDAVLVDARGSIYDSVGGLDWDRYDDAGYADGDATVYARPQDRGYPPSVYAQDGYRDGYAPRDRRSRGGGIGGAVAGAAVGGVAGNLIAGRGNRLGGTLIGAGVGAAAGYAIDRSANHGRREPPIAPEHAPGYGDDYGAGYAPPPPPPPPHIDARPPTWVSPDGATTITTTTGGYAGGYGGGGYGRGYAYGSGGTTTIVVQSAPVVTTTTTEYYEDRVSYSRPVAKKVWRKRVWHPKPRCGCR